MTDTFHVLNPGMLTTIQDLGRIGYGQYGIPVSGAMDRFSFQVANLLVGNAPGAAALETTLYRLKIEILRPVCVAITGGDMHPTLDGQPLPMWQALDLPAGGTLLFKTIRSGARAYLAVAGGIDSPVQLGSRSTHQKAFLGKALNKGDIVRTFPAKRRSPGRRLPESLIPAVSKKAEIRVVLGPQDDLFSAKGIETFLSEIYTISGESDRQGYRLLGEPVAHVSGADIISDAILPGAVQVPGNGQPIIMMVDAQTTGGYPKIASVVGPDIDILAQMLPGRKVGFKAVSIEAAHQMASTYSDRLTQLRKTMST